MAPIEIRLEAAGRALSVAWDGGLVARLPAELLRSNCRSAGAIRRALAGVELPAEIRITGVELVGNYAVNLAFSDGEGRGLYPWNYLRGLAGMSNLVRDPA